MPQYELFFFCFFFFNGKGMHPRCLSKTWQLFIVNRVAGGSTKKVCLFWTNRDKRSLFTRRYDGCYHWEFPVCMIVNRTSANQNTLHVDHVYECAYVFFKWWALFTFLLVEKTHLLCLHHPRLWIRYILDFLFVVLFSLLIIWLENFASGSVHMSLVRLTFSYLSIVPCVCVNDLLAGLGRDNGRMKILMPVPYEFT